MAQLAPRNNWVRGVFLQGNPALLLPGVEKDHKFPEQKESLWIPCFHTYPDSTCLTSTKGSLTQAANTFTSGNLVQTKPNILLPPGHFVSSCSKVYLKKAILTRK